MTRTTDQTSRDQTSRDQTSRNQTSRNQTSRNQSSRRDLLSVSLPLALSGTGLLALTARAQHGGERAGDSPAPTAMPPVFAEFARDGSYTLPKLPYAYDALEPHIDAATMELHHSKHHQAYVDGINRAVKAMRELDPAGGDPRVIETLQRDISFNAGGHVMHTIFWAIMGPGGGGEPRGVVAELINASFKSYDAFKAIFTRVALSVKGSGWAVLAWEPFGGQLITVAMGDQDTRLVAGMVPLLAVDVWEHAYYLKYQNRRRDYVEAWYNTINWDAVNAIAGRGT